jgi:hypothetical protein
MPLITCKIPDKLAAELENLPPRGSLEICATARSFGKSKAMRRSRSMRAYDLIRHLVGSLHGKSTDLAMNLERMKGFGE